MTQNEKTNKAVVFDLDGTLVDSLADLTDSVNWAMQRLSLPTYTSDQVRQMIGNGVSILMQRAVTEKYSYLHATALKLQRSYYAEHSFDHTCPYNGIEQMLCQLKNSGATVIVHTNKDENIAADLCKKLFGNKVDFVCGTVKDSAIKPDARRLLSLLASLGNPTAVYCGDSEVDVATSANAGLPCVSVTWGFRDEDFLRKHGATHFVYNPSEVPNTIRRLWQEA